MKIIIRYLLICCSVIMFGIGYWFNDFNMIFISIMMLFLNNILYALESTGKRIVFLLFNISYFTFLLGQYFFEILKRESLCGEFPPEVVLHTLFTLFISLLFIYSGMTFAEIFNNKKNINYKLTQKDYLIVHIRNFSKVMFYVTYFINFISLLEVVVFIQQNGYIALYMDFSSQIPLVIKKISLTCLTFFYIYLATLPQKREARKIVILQLFYLGTSILTGVRGTAVVGLFTLFAYCIFRDICMKDLDEKWIGRIEKRIIVLSLPFFIAFLSAYNSVRIGIKVENFSVLDEVIGFFKSQGGSFQVISYSKLYEDLLPTTNSSYVFGPIINYFTVGTVASLFTGLSPITDKINMALYGNNMGATITYLVAPQYYLAGGGFGTQYIAELYADFGYFGVAVFNFIVGMLLDVILSATYRRWWLFAIGLLTCNAIFAMPRNFALTWIGVWYALPTWLPIILTLVVAKRMYGKSIQKNRSNVIQNDFIN